MRPSVLRPQWAGSRHGRRTGCSRGHVARAGRPHGEGRSHPARHHHRAVAAEQSRVVRAGRRRTHPRSAGRRGGCGPHLGPGRRHRVGGAVLARLAVGDRRTAPRQPAPGRPRGGVAVAATAVGDAAVPGTHRWRPRRGGGRAARDERRARRVLRDAVRRVAGRGRGGPGHGVPRRPGLPRRGRRVDGEAPCAPGHASGPRGPGPRRRELLVATGDPRPARLGTGHRRAPADQPAGLRPRRTPPRHARPRRPGHRGVRGVRRGPSPHPPATPPRPRPRAAPARPIWLGSRRSAG